MKRFVVLSIGIMLFLSTFTSCKDNSKIDTNTSRTKTANSDEWFSKTGYPIITDTSKMPTIEVYKGLTDLEPEDPKENLWMQKATKETGVDFQWVTVPNSSSGERVSMMLATADLPDVFWSGIAKEQVTQYIDSDIFMPVEGLIDEYMPNLKKIFEEHPEYKAMCTAPDGHIYGFPRVEEMNGLTATPGGVYVNKNWLEQVDLEVPTTYDQWIDMLYAFEDAGDLNGNGIKDEYALSWDYAEGWDNIFAWVSGCFGTPDVTNGADALTNHMAVTKDNQLVFVPTLESFRKTASEFHKFYKDGLLNPDSFAPVASGVSLHKQKLQQDVAMLGTFMAWGRDGNISDIDVKDEYIAQPRIQSEQGKSGYIRNTSELSQTSLAVITTECENPEVVARFVDYCYAPKNSVTLNWGAEDFVYVTDENNILRWDVDESGNMNFKNDFTEFWQMREFSTIGGPNIILNEYYDTVVEYPRDAQNLYDEQVASGKVELLEEYTAVTPMLWFLPEEQATLDQLRPQINNVVDSTTQRWIIDGGAESEFENFKDELNAAGLQQFLEIYQASYDRYIANMQ
ncbi:MAG: hypothetical protein ACK5LT_00280 [Lachnospirales bacterium]